MSLRLAPALPVLTFAAALALPVSAQAIEPKAAADALAAAMSSGSRAKVTYSDAARDGADIVIKGLTVSHAARGEAEAAAGSAADTTSALAIAQTVIESPVDGTDSIFTAPAIRFSDATVTGDLTGTIPSAELTGVTVYDPKAVKGTQPARGVLAEHAEARDLSLTVKPGTDPITIARIAMDTGDVVDKIPQSSKGTVERVIVPDSAFAGNALSPKALGYDNLVANMTWDAGRDAAKNTFALRDMTVGVENGGNLKITGIAGNMPDPATLNDPDAAQKSSATELHTATVRYDDLSLTGRVLDYLSKQQGITRETYANQIAVALPFLLAAVNNPDFQTELAGALGAFLRDPKSLTLKIEPPAPISFAEISSIARSAMQTLPDRLNVSVTANGAE